MRGERAEEARLAEEARAAAPPAADRTLLARALTEALSPLRLVPALLIIVAWASAPDPSAALAWGLGTAVLAMGAPLLYLRRQIRAGRVSDHHVTARRRRPMLLFITLVSLLATLAVARAGGAPRMLVALVAALLAGLGLFLLITLAWKISFHAGVSAGAVGILTLVFGPAMLLFSPAVPLLAWARVRLGDHTPAQVAAGAILGALVAGGVFTLLR